MARDATARLYDVAKDSVVFKKLGREEKYDHGTITFRAKDGKLIDLDKLHESVWATRLSGGTRSGLLKLEVTAVGAVAKQGDDWTLKVDGSSEYFLLGDDSESKAEDGKTTVFEQLKQAVAQGTKVTSVTGRLDGWSGRWPELLRAKPPKPRRILISSFQVAE